MPSIVDIASHASAANRPAVRFQQVEPAASSVPPAPAFLFGAMTAETARSIYGPIDTPQTGCYAIANAVVAPTGVATCHGVAFGGAQLNLPPAHVATIMSRFGAADLPVHYVVGPLVSLLGPAEEAYLHLVVDYLPRLWLLEQAGLVVADVRFLLPASPSAKAEELLAQLGLLAEQMIRYAHWEEAVCTDLLILPTTLRREDRLSPRFGDATRFWVQRVRHSLQAPAPTLRDRIFLTCVDADDAAQTVAKQAGFRIVYPDGMDLAERVAVFGSAACIAGMDDMRFYDCVFCAPGAKLCVFRQDASSTGFLLAGVARAAGLRIGYVFGAATDDIARGLDNLGM